MKADGSLLIGTILLLASSGCSQNEDPYPRVGYFGTVTLDGAPLVNGFLYLEPLERQPTQSHAIIHDGFFEVAPEAGAVPGRYRVSIVRDESADLPEGIDLQTPEGAALADKLSRQSPSRPLHPTYNIRSKLVAELKVDDVNEFEFQLETNPEQPTPQPAGL